MGQTNINKAMLKRLEMIGDAIGETELLLYKQKGVLGRVKADIAADQCPFKVGDCIRMKGDMGPEHGGVYVHYAKVRNIFYQSDPPHYKMVGLLSEYGHDYRPDDIGNNPRWELDK